MGKRSVALNGSIRRILYVAYPLLPVSTESCGGAEQMLAVLEAEISSRGYFTTVAACNGSQPSGTLFSTGPATTQPDCFPERDAEHQSRVLDLLRDTNGTQSRFDLVHDKSGGFWRRAAECEVPVLGTLHLPRHFYPEDSFNDLPANLYLNCVSSAQQRSFADVPNLVGVIPNGIQVSRFPFVPEKQDYLLWMGRICEEKRPHLAIEVAQKTGLPLVLAGQVYPFSYHQLYYNERIRPHLRQTQPRICFVETPTFATKVRILSNARALLLPSLVDETSSLVAMEAMACGTPVVAFRRGAIPEVVIDGVTGFIVDDLEAMAEAVWQTSALNPYACRVHIETSYTSSRMASQYEDLYEAILSSEEERFERARLQACR